MSYSLEEIKRDIRDMDCRQFYLQHILRSDNWYFEKILIQNIKNTLKEKLEYKHFQFPYQVELKSILKEHKELHTQK